VSWAKVKKITKKALAEPSKLGETRKNPKNNPQGESEPGKSGENN